MATAFFCAEATDGDAANKFHSVLFCPEQNWLKNIRVF